MLVSAATAAVELGPDGTGRVGTGPSFDSLGVIRIAVDHFLFSNSWKKRFAAVERQMQTEDEDDEDDEVEDEELSLIHI